MDKGNNTSSRQDLKDQISSKRSFTPNLPSETEEWGSNLLEKCLNYASKKEKRQILYEISEGLQDEDFGHRVQTIAICSRKAKELSVISKYIIFR